jgi:sugar/nucleoside kinase (ribokinase family)
MGQMGITCTDCNVVECGGRGKISVHGVASHEFPIQGVQNNLVDTIGF